MFLLGCVFDATLPGWSPGGSECGLVESLGEAKGESVPDDECWGVWIRNEAYVSVDEPDACMIHERCVVAFPGSVVRGWVEPAVPANVADTVILIGDVDPSLPGECLYGSNEDGFVDLTCELTAEEAVSLAEAP